MARTLKGNLTGKAASIHLAEQREALFEAELRRIEAEKAAKLAEIEQRKDQYGSLIDSLKELDPQGWSAWYDAFVPDWRGFLSDGFLAAVKVIEARIKDLQAAQVTPAPAPVTLQWKVIVPNTQRAYAAAVKDFETVTGLKVERADAGSLASYRKALELRGLASNTIRQRLSAISTISGVKVSLPKRQPAERMTLEAAQIRTMMSHVTDRADRMLLARLLTLGSTARATQISDNSFMSHFIGAEREHTLASQKVTRLLKRVARKAGIDARQVNMRTWCLSGRKLVDTLSPAELVALLGQADDAVKTTRALHGIGRRSFQKV